MELKSFTLLDELSLEGTIRLREQVPKAHGALHP